MHLSPLAHFTVIALSLAGCKPATKPPEGHVRVELSWSGLTAEIVRQEISVSGLEQNMKLAIIDDDHASLYYPEDLSKVDSIIKSVKTKGRLPHAVVFGNITRIPTPVPEPPKPTVVRRLHFNAKSEAATALGISLDELNRVIGSLSNPAEKTDDTNFLNGRYIMSSNGEKAPLDQLVEVTIIQLTRPLVIDHR